MTIKKFGQTVLLEVFGAGDELVFSSDGLRVDFNIVNIPGFSRGTFKVWNLDDSTVKKIQHGERYCTLSVSQHDGPTYVLADKFYVSNAFEQTVVPNSITSLFGYSAVKKNFLNKQVKTAVKNPTLKNILRQVKEVAKWDGEFIYNNFPAATTSYAPPALASTRSGSVEGLLECLATHYHFKYFTIGKDISLMYQPTAENIGQTDLSSVKDTVVINSDNLGAAPKIGAGSINLNCNLDPLIIPTSIIDIGNIISVAPDIPDNKLQVSENYLKDALAGFTIYQVLTVVHEGSNFTGLWNTNLVGSSPTKGKSSPIRGWDM